MLHLFKKPLKAIGILFLLQIAGYYTLAEWFLPAVIADHRRALVIEETDKVYFDSSRELSDAQVTKVSSILQHTFPEVVYGKNERPIDSDRTVCYYSFGWQLPLPFFALVKYHNVYQAEQGGDAYAEGFEARYIWILAFWWETSHRNTGQS